MLNSIEDPEKCFVLVTFVKYFHQWHFQTGSESHQCWNQNIFGRCENDTLNSCLKMCFLLLKLWLLEPPSIYPFMFFKPSFIPDQAQEEKKMISMMQFCEKCHFYSLNPRIRWVIVPDVFWLLQDLHSGQRQPSDLECNEIWCWSLHVHCEEPVWGGQQHRNPLSKRYFIWIWCILGQFPCIAIQVLLLEKKENTHLYRRIIFGAVRSTQPSGMIATWRHLAAHLITWSPIFMGCCLFLSALCHQEGC